MEYRKVNAIINTLMLKKVDTALRDIQVPGDGIVAITPVERIYCIRTKSAQSLLGINAAEPLE